MHQAVYSLNTHPGHATQLGLGHALCTLTHMAYVHLDCTHTTCTHVHGLYTLDPHASPLTDGSCTQAQHTHLPYTHTAPTP